MNVEGRSRFCRYLCLPKITNWTQWCLWELSNSGYSIIQWFSLFHGLKTQSAWAQIAQDFCLLQCISDLSHLKKLLKMCLPVFSFLLHTGYRIGTVLFIYLFIYLVAILLYTFWFILNVALQEQKGEICMSHSNYLKKYMILHLV